MKSESSDEFMTDFDLRYFYPLDMGEVATVNNEVGNLLSFTDSELAEHGHEIEFEFKLIEGRMQAWRQKNADKKSEQENQTFMPGDPRAMLDDPL